MLDVNLAGMEDFVFGLELHRIPWVALTAAGAVSSEHQQHFAAFLAKPLKPARLAEVLSAAFSGNVVRKAAAGPELDADLGRRLPLRILIAEDNAVNQKVAVRLLERMGYQPDVAANGVETLRALENREYDVLFMDVHMPEMDGLEATRRIRRQWPGVGPRIIAMTANAFPDDRQRCLAAGMDDYIAKPIRVSELQAALERCTPASRPTAELTQLPIV
jgi:CheY-like chemotaxis protein